MVDALRLTNTDALASVLIFRQVSARALNNELQIFGPEHSSGLCEYRRWTMRTDPDSLAVSRWNK